MESSERDQARIEELWPRITLRVGAPFPDLPPARTGDGRILFADLDTPVEAIVARGSNSMRALANEADALALLSPRALAPRPLALLAFGGAGARCGVLLIERIDGEKFDASNERLPEIVRLLSSVHGTCTSTTYSRGHGSLVESLGRVAGHALSTSQRRFLAQASERRACTSSLVRVHGDLRLSNLLSTARGIRLIDFEHSGIDAVEQDLGGLLLCIWPSGGGIGGLAEELVRLYTTSLPSFRGGPGRVTPCSTCILLYAAHRHYRNLEQPSFAPASTGFTQSLLEAFGWN